MSWLSLAIVLAIIVLAGSGCEQAQKTEPARNPPAESTPADTTPQVLRVETSPHPIALHEIAELRKLGFRDPVAQIVEDLRKHPEVIPYSGVLGSAKMGFYDPNGIRVLSKRWVYARFEDGHVGGSGVFEFAVQPGGSLSWKVVTSELDQ